MRRSELLRVERRDVDLDRRTLHIPKTKNGHARTIPLTLEAVAIQGLWCNSQ
jgi:integrase